MNEIINALGIYANEQHGLRAGTRDRRAHVRLRPGELSSEVRARLRHGPLLTLIDLSAGGALIETSTRIAPGARVTLEFIRDGASRIMVMPTRIMRAEVASLRDGVQYRGGCAFTDLLRVPEVLSAARRAVGSPPGEKVPLEAVDLVLAMTQWRRTAAEPALARLLDEIIPLARRGESPRALMARVEHRLRGQIPLLAISVTPRALHGSRRHAITFELPQRGIEDDGVWQVEFHPACQLDAPQLELLEAGAAVLGMLRSWRDRTALAIC
jgi:hypothetical protein